MGLRVLAGIALLLAGCAGAGTGHEAATAQVKAVQDALVVRNVAQMGNDGAVVELTYQGKVAVDKLVLAMGAGTAKVLADAGRVVPGQTFNVTFEQAGSGLGAGGKVRITVEAVE